MGKFILAYLLLLLSFVAQAQNVPLLERNLNISIDNLPVAQALDKIAAQGNFTFSYTPSVLPQKNITLTARNKSVRQVLAMALGNDVSYKASGKYIILSKAPEKPGKKITVSGYVYDKNSGKKVPNTSVYDEKTMTSAVTNQYGYYEIEVPSKSTNLQLNVKKDEYGDTILSLPIKNQLVEITIQPADTATPYTGNITPPNPFKEVGAKFFKSAKGFINTVNIKDTINRRFQLSFLPYMGTNHKLSANVVNQVSVNVLGGYSLGNKGAEFGGIFNINRRGMQGFQAGGIFNINGASSSGFQAGGIFNTVSGSYKGFQAGGISNMVRDTFSGFQAAGLINFVGGTFNGFQAAGLINFANGHATGFKAAGLANISAKQHTGATAAGLFNYAYYQNNGAQIAGLFNMANNLSRTAQIAGLCNIAFKKSGTVQLAGLFNYATNVTGLQLAPFNFADTVSKGIPIGVASFVRKGLHQLELSADELLFTNLSFRTGILGFHNIFSAGVQLTNTQSPLWSIGYGIGTGFRLSKRFNFDIDLTYSHISKGAFNTDVNFLNRLYLGPEFAITRKIRVALGPTVNLFLSDTQSPDYAAIYSGLAPYTFSNYTATQNNLNIKWWVGGKVAIRFF
jgi:hypothetical protein